MTISGTMVVPGAVVRPGTHWECLAAPDRSLGAMASVSPSQPSGDSCSNAQGGMGTPSLSHGAPGALPGVGGLHTSTLSHSTWASHHCPPGSPATACCQGLFREPAVQGFLVPSGHFRWKYFSVRIAIIWKIQPNNTPANACLFKNSFTLRERSPKCSLPHGENIQGRVCCEVRAPYSSPSGPFAVHIGIVQALSSPPVRDRIMHRNISLANS